MIYLISGILFTSLALVAPSLSYLGEFSLYEGNEASQDQVCTLYWNGDDEWNFQHFDACTNDEVRSGILRKAGIGTTITLYDSPSGDKGDDYTIIKVKGDLDDDVVIGTFEKNQVLADGVVEIVHHHHNGLDGKISRVEV